jgi:uncharacterized protein (DUF1810 family)
MVLKPSNKLTVEEYRRITFAHTKGIQRFLDAHQLNYAYERADNELYAGKKETHWMWYIFPQSYGLGTSVQARIYGILSVEEARAYLLHSILGPRYLKCVCLVERHLNGELGPKKTLEDIFGETDAQKYRSSVALFLP